MQPRHTPCLSSGYTGEVDRVRLGRALGYGTRHMAKTVAAVAEAAAASPGSRPVAAPQTHTSAVSAETTSQTGAHAEKAGSRVPESEAAPHRFPVLEGRILPNRAAARNLNHHARHLKDSVWQPLAVFSGALWLRVTGTFFALIAVTMGSAAWRGHYALRTTRDLFSAHHFWLFTLFAILFGYFAVSNFVRANLKERQGQIRR